MRASVEPLEGNKVKLSVEVDETEFEKAVDATFRKIARELRIPGFRPGKAPRRVIEARLGKDGLRQEALRESLPDFYAQAVRDNDVDVIAPPDIDVTSGDESGPITFNAVVEVRPRVSIAGYEGLQVTVPNPTVTDEEVDRQVDRLRRSFGELKDVDRPAADGDHVNIDINGSRGGERDEGLSADDFLYEVGSGSIVEGLDDQLRGAKVGDIVSFDTTLAGDDVSFRVLVKNVKEMVLPEPTDDWAQEASEFETVEELRDDLRARIGEVKKMQTRNAIREQAVEALAELIAEDIPDALVRSELERRLHDLAHRLQHQGATIAQYLSATGQSEEEFIESLRGAATDAVKADLGLRALVEAESIEVTDDDIDAEIARVAEEVGQKPADVRRQLERNDQMPAVRSDLRKAKALEWLVEHVEVIDEEGNPVDRDALAAAQAEAPPDDEQAGSESDEEE